MVVTMLVVTMLVVIVILALMYMMILLDAAVKHALKLGVDRILINFVLPCCFVWRFLCVFKEVHAKKNITAGCVQSLCCMRNHIDAYANFPSICTTHTRVTD